MANARHSWRRTLAGAAAALILFTGAVPSALGAQTSWRINPARTRIGFVVDAVGWPQTKGQFHTFDGRIAINLDKPETSHVAFRVAAGSVDVGSPSFNDYLRTDAFFDAARYPFITFESTRVEKVDDRHGRITGNLTLRGVTQPLTIDVELDRGSTAIAREVGFRASGVIHRLAYNMSAGFPAISNDVNLIVTTEALAD